FLVGAAADDPSRVEDDDLVGPADGRHALGDDDDRGLTGRFVEGGPQPRVGGDVEGGERIVEDVDLRFDGQRSGDAQALSLPARVVRASLGDAFLEPVLLLRDEVIGLGDAQGLPELVVAGVVIAEAQVRSDRPGEQVGFCGTRPISWANWWRLKSVTGTPSMRTCPCCGSMSLGMRLTIVDFPEPVEPMIAVVVPGRAVKFRSSRTGTSAPGYPKVTLRDSSSPRRGISSTPAGILILVRESSTSAMRSAQTTGRGIIIIMNTPIITATRICRRYCRKAVSEPTSICPASTRWPPNQSTAAVARWRTIMIAGNMRTKRLPTLTEVSVRALLASA